MGAISIVNTGIAQNETERERYDFFRTERSAEVAREKAQFGGPKAPSPSERRRGGGWLGYS